jgi:hypothetical protein
MSKQVQCFIFSHNEKVGKGILDFFEEKYFKDYLKDGGSLVIRWEEGDTTIAATTPQPTNQECTKVCNEIDEWESKINESILKQPKGVQEDMRKLISLLQSTKTTIRRLKG